MSLFRRKPKEPLDTSAVSEAVAVIANEFDIDCIVRLLGHLFHDISKCEPLVTYLQTVIVPKLTPHAFTHNIPAMLDVFKNDPVVGPVIGPTVQAFFEAFNG